MKPLLTLSMKLAAALLLVLFALIPTARAQSGKLQMSQLDHLASKASETVDVNIDERLIQLTAKFLSSKDPDEAKVKEIVNGLKGIYVKVFEFEHPGEYSTADVDSIRSQLHGTSWNRIVNVTSKKDGTLEVYLLTEGERIAGLTVLAAEPNELTVVNLVGPVDLEKLTQLQGEFGIPDLEIQSPKAKPKN